MKQFLVLLVILITPLRVTLQTGNQMSMNAVCQSDQGVLHDCTTPVQWSSLDADVATIDDTGVVTAVGEGTTTVTAVVGGVTGQATVTVYGPQ